MKKTLMIVSAALLLAGIAVMVSSVAANRKAARANDWEQQRAAVERVEGGNVSYSYEAGGSTRRGVAPARPRVDYTAGKKVLVYVNPANPAESLLDLPPRPPTWPPVAGGVLLLVGASLAVAAWLEGKKSAAKPGPAKAKSLGDTTSRRKAPPLARLQPPPPVKWKRDDEGTPSPETPLPSPPDAPSGTRGTPQ